MSQNATHAHTNPDPRPIPDQAHMDDKDAITSRQRWMSVLARTDARDLEDHWAEKFANEDWRLLREPQIGMVMVRARAGGAGQRFNLGEMTVTRCSVALADGTVGHGYVKGRDKKHARFAALFDAVMLRDGAAQDFIDRQSNQQAGLRNERAHKTAATKVDFFTLVRGED